MDPENNDKSPSTPAPDSPATPPAGEPSTQHSSAPAPSGGDAPAAAAAEAPKSALEAVKAVMDKGRAAAASAAAPAPGAAAPAAPASAAPTADQPTPGAEANGFRLTKEQFEALPPLAQKRIGWLTSQARKATDAFEQVKPQVQAYNDLQAWAGRNNVNQDDYGFALEFIALVKSDPAKAYERLQPVLKYLRAHVGEELPADLSAEVEEGKITRERAQELAKARAETHRLSESTRQRAEADEQRQAAEAVQGQNKAITLAIAGYEHQWKGSDPDYPKKQKQVSSNFLMALDERRRAGNPVTDPQEAVQLLAKARKEVEDWMSGFIPRPAPISGIPPSGADSRVRTEPKTALEAAQRGLERARQPAAA